jgi:hypothetical protein
MIRVLFISHSKRGAFYYNDASARYRCVFPAEHFNDIGIKTHVIHFSQIGAVTLSSYSHVIFHRPQFSLKLKFYVNKLKGLGIKTIADFDDLLFNPELASQSAAVQAGYMSLALAKKHAQAYKKALTLFSHCWVSTTLLAKQLSACHKPMHIRICYNKLPPRWASLQPIIPWQDRLKSKVIRYMPGTSHHKHDFKKVEDFLVQLLTENSDIQLEIVGDLSFNSKAFPQAQISQQHHMSFEQLPSAIHTSWLTLAPLETNVFNQCKSGLKFWESGLYGVPVISSELEDIQRFHNPGLCISNNMQQWLDYIETMKHPATYKIACDHAMQKAQATIFSHTIPDERLADLDTGNINKNLYSQIKNNTLKQEQTQHIQSNQQLIMCANIGPRWPAIQLDPTHLQNKLAASLVQNTEGFNRTLSKHEMQNLQRMADANTASDTPERRSVIKRKLRKLWNTPYDFFKDMKNKIINKP